MTDAAVLAAFAMIGSAALHAVLSLLTKRAQDKLVFRSVMMLAGALLYSPVLFLLPPPPWEAWRFLLIGAAIHWIFQMSLIASFERGDMNLVYPVMRGAAPALAGLAALFILGEPLGPLSGFGLALASAAVVGFGWPERGGAPKAAALAFALVAASMTALYSVNDASGARAAGNPLVYVAWFFAVTSTPLFLTALIRRGRRLPALMAREARTAALGAVFGAASYGLALYAFANAPVAPMAALRETSVVFGAILAALVLKEPFGTRRIVLAVVLVIALAALQAG
jgi:drug/metabolite transporter (DMT)-like permease